ncbi:MAG: hypothetical protein RIC55_36200 [Pirellulaceae bacterium]
MNAIALDQWKRLFRDDESFAEFVQGLESHSKHDMNILLSGNRVVGSLLSPEGTRNVLYERMLKRIAENPALLAEIADRLESDDIVD